jgi:hypothetical protein
MTARLVDEFSVMTSLANIGSVSSAIAIVIGGSKPRVLYRTSTNNIEQHGFVMPICMRMRLSRLLQRAYYNGQIFPRDSSLHIHRVKVVLYH